MLATKQRVKLVLACFGFVVVSLGGWEWPLRSNRCFSLSIIIVII